MKRIYGILILFTCLLLTSCSSNPETDFSKEITQYQNEIARLEESVIKLTEEISVKDQLIDELRLDEKEVKGLAARKLDTERYNKELLTPVKQNFEDHSYNFYGPLSGGYTISSSLEGIKKIRSALISFTRLTEMVRTGEHLTDEDLAMIGNTDGTYQMIEFTNTPTDIESQLIEQNYIIKMIDLKYAIAQYELGRIEKKELDMRFNRYLDGKEQTQNYMNVTYRIDYIE